MSDRVAHPLLISLANIYMNTQVKSSSNSFMLTALLAVRKFLDKNKGLHGVLGDCVIHQWLDIVLKALKEATVHGIMLLDPMRQSDYCFTQLASYIVDTREVMMLACVGGKTSAVTMGMYKQFGDCFHYECRTASTTLAQIYLHGFFCEARKLHWNGVFEAFLWDWVVTDPSHLFRPETLHVLDKKILDHDTKWVMFAVGELEIDLHFSVLQAVTSFWDFAEGISKVKEVTGCCQRDIQHSIVAVSADAARHGVLVERL
ncbi:uncharacterized protein F5891DRAFT_961159 [Suillus fuscotomentosus]|uniref:Uncharacterized protein n=1 Tax=Suillus fuscotomentosus TaxID=1912939 RepID=A0AAD4DQ53_9AGAM|nr:uncharacterized protein F5891DRAFT_965779 [Suillus fuscotomentosus]XP_041220298.1 uncharacterized protein F5891DRAFT_961159 [Suillus fuscotomentosus]KAG1889008.1 hypothetical protein F5891DRAFT_965779 [Suillus fuscotomentosus]KAG1894722.1 hypothetical protein F5891DRAFT_961159 [Suillus fuscotomentosus]